MAYGLRTIDTTEDTVIITREFDDGTHYQEVYYKDFKTFEKMRGKLSPNEIISNTTEISVNGKKYFMYGINVWN